MDDGVGIAATLYQPDGHAPPPAGPAVMLFHGLGGNRQSIAPIAQLFARARLRRARRSTSAATASRAGCSPGSAPRELAGRRAPARALAAANAPHDERQGRRLGHLARRRRRCSARSARATPFAALEVAETWTDLYERARPAGPRRSRARSSSSSARCRATARRPSSLAVQRRGRAAATSRRCGRSRGARSSRQLLSARVPADATSSRGDRTSRSASTRASPATQRRSGPKRLYVGAVRPRAVDVPRPGLRARDAARARSGSTATSRASRTASRPHRKVELVRRERQEPVGSYTALPPTVRRRLLAARDRSTIGSAGKVVRRARTDRRCARDVRRADASTSARARRRGWSHLVAVLVARTPNGREIVVSEGGAPTSARPRSRALVTIRLISQAKRIPAGSRLELTLAGNVDGAERREPPLLGSGAAACEDHRAQRDADDSRASHAGLAMSRVALVALVATLVAIPGAYARPSATPGVTAPRSCSAASGPLSGPEVAYAGTMIGANAYFDYVNAHGRSLRTQDRVPLPRRRLRPVADRAERRASSCSRTTCSRSSTSSAPSRTSPCGRS